MGFDQGCGIKGFLPTSVIQGNPPSYEQNSLWEALSVVSQKWSFPTALVLTHSHVAICFPRFVPHLRRLGGSKGGSPPALALWMFQNALRTRLDGG